MAPVIGVGIGLIRRQYRVVTTTDLTAPNLSAESFTDNGSEGVNWSFIADENCTYRVSLWADGSTPTSGERESGTGSLVTVTGSALAATIESGTFASTGDGTYVPTIFVMDGAGNKYSETYADIVVAPFADVTPPTLSLESFTDAGSEGVDWTFTSDENCTYRVSLWTDGATPSAADIESGSGSVVTTTGSAIAMVAETGTFLAVGDATYVPTIWVSDSSGNEYTETYADVTVAPGVAGPRRTTDSVTVGALNTYDLPLTIESDGEVGDTVKWVIARTGEVTPLSDAAKEAAILAGTVPGGVGGAGNHAFGAASATLPTGIARHTDYVLMLLVDAGSGGTVAVSTTFTADTISPVVTGESFTDGGAENISYSFQTDEIADFRFSAWVDGTVPSAANLAAGSGTGFISSVTGTTVAATPETGTLGCGNGTIVPGLWVRDIYGNEYTEVYADLVVAAADVRLTDSGALYWFASDDTTRSGTNVTAINDKRGGFDLDTRPNPPFTSAIQQASPGAVMQFGSGVRGLQTSTAATGNAKMITHMDGGGSNAMRAFLVVNPAAFGTAAAIHFCESVDNNANNSAFFGAYRNSSNFVVVSFQFRSSSNAMSASPITTTVPSNTIGLCIIEYYADQSGYEIFINGVSVGSGTITPANFPGTQNVRTTLGARASNTTTTTPAYGDFHEVYVTTTADASTANSIRSAIATQYGITI